MSLRFYLAFMTFGTILCWTAWVVVVNSIDPVMAGLLGLIFFYLSLFLALIGTASVMGFLIRKSIYKDSEIIFRQVKRTFRQSIILALLTIICLEFLRREWFHWWNALILILLGLTIEGLIFTKRKFSNVEL